MLSILLRTDVIRIWNMRVSIPENFRFWVNYTVFHTPKHYKIIIRVQEWQIDKNNSEKKGECSWLSSFWCPQVNHSHRVLQRLVIESTFQKEHVWVPGVCTFISLQGGMPKANVEQKKCACWRQTIQRQEQYFSLYAPVWNFWCRKGFMKENVVFTLTTHSFHIGS